MFRHGTSSIKKTSGHVGTRICVAGLSQQTCYALHHHASPKKDASSTELRNTVFFHPSNVNSHIMTDAISVMYSILLHRSLYIIYIYSNILSWKIIEKKKTLATWDSNLRRRSQSTDMICSTVYAIMHLKKGCIKPRAKQHCLFPFVQC